MTVLEFLNAWNKAELTDDTEAIAPMLTDDFTSIGPLGFTLSKKDWLDRHGPLRYERLELAEITTRTYGEATVVTATQLQQATYNSHPVPTTNRVSIVVVHRENEWKIANIHFSFVAGTEGAPPIPGRSN